MKYRIHLLGFPHTATNGSWAACAYTQKIAKFVRMMAPRGHTIIHYGNEGSRVECAHVQIFTDAERESFYGKHDPTRAYDCVWNPKETAWMLWNSRAIAEIAQRVQTGDFVLGLASDCHKPIADALGPMAWFVEFGIGYYGTFSPYRIFESNTHREWLQGSVGNKNVDWGDATIPNYFDPEEFLPVLGSHMHALETLRSTQPAAFQAINELDQWLTTRRMDVFGTGGYFMFLGRLNDDKGWRIAVETTAKLGAPLVLAGPGTISEELPAHVYRFWVANIQQRAILLNRAIASFAPTLYREPFGGVAVEAMMSGIPCITTDFGGFVETVPAKFRCHTLKEFVKAAQSTMKMSVAERATLQESTKALYSLQAIAPQYERYFDRLHSRWRDGWYEMGDLETIVPRSLQLAPLAPATSGGG